MPLIKDDVDLFHPLPKPEYRADIMDKTYRHNVVDTKKIPLDSLLTNIEGHTWVVDYYSQVLGKDDEPKDLNPSDDQPYQQYEHIKRYQMKLQGDLSTSFDNAQNRATVTGTAIIYPKLIPNKGDVVVGDMGDGRAGRFTVTQVTQKSFFGNTCYEIDLELASIMTKEMEDILQSKVVRVGHFVKDFMVYGQNPVLMDEDYDSLVALEEAKKTLLGEFLSKFYSHEKSTLLVPVGRPHYKVYDPYVVKLITSVFSSNDHPLVGRIKVMNVNDLTLTGNTDIWTAILQREQYLLGNCFRQYRVVSTKKFYGSFNQNPVSGFHTRPIRYSGVDAVVTPVYIPDEINHPIKPFDLTFPFPIDELNLDENKKWEQFDEGVQLPIVSNGDYVVSRHVYDLDDDLTNPLEQQLRNYFQAEYVDPRIILNYYKHRKSFTPLQTFYSYPLLLLLIIHCIRSINE